MSFIEEYGLNENCLKCSNREERDKYLYDGGCQHALSLSDYLICRCVGPWAKEKIIRLVKYFGIFTNGMHKKWEKINYIEIGSGPGICIDRESGNEFDGTPLSIIKNESYQYIEKVIFIDKDTNVVGTLNKRIDAFDGIKAISLSGDYTSTISISELLVSNIDPNSLNLVFIDPTDCSIPLETIEIIKGFINKVDFIINVATRTDFNRNITNIIKDPVKYKKSREKYISFLGTDIFNVSEFIDAVETKKLDNARNIFRDVYKESLEKIGLKYFDYKHVGNFYDLLFASAHPKGLEFWHKANDIEPNGQRNLFLG